MNYYELPRPESWKVERNGKKWKFIEQELGRVAETCRDKYRELLVEPTRGRETKMPPYPGKLENVGSRTFVFIATLR